MLNVALLSVVMLIAFMLRVAFFYTECLYTECRHAECCIFCAECRGAKIILVSLLTFFIYLFIYFLQKMSH
jgi:hypothetical protein